MPELETPNFPKGKYPRLSPNPNDPGLELKNGGQETPVIIGTEPQTQGKYDNEQDAKIAAIEAQVRVIESEVDGKMENPMTAANDLIVGGTSGAPTRLAKGSNGSLLGVDGSGSVAYKNDLPYLTTAPNEANANGVILVVLDEEPATRYNGYLYLIVGSVA